MLNASSIAQFIRKSGQGLQTLNPRQIGLLATDLATKDTQIGLDAEDWISTAPGTWWTGWDKPNPTAIWDIGGNPTPLPKTGASLLNSIYDPVSGYEFKPPVAQPSAMAQVTTLAGQNGAATQPTGVVQPGSTVTGVDPRTGTVAGTGKDFVPIVQEKPFTAEGGGQYATAEEARTASLGSRTIDKKTDAVLSGIKNLLTAGQPEAAARKRDAAISELENYLTALLEGDLGPGWTPELIASETQLVNSGLERLRGAIPENLRMQKMRQAMGNKLSAENMKWMSGNISYIENLLKSGTENDIWKAHEYWNSTANLGPDIWNQVQSLNLFPELHTFNTQAEYVASSATGGIKTLKSVSDPVVETAAAVETIPVSAVYADVT